MIFHLALVSDWDAARAAGEYTVSTRGASLADVGFVHCSTAEQWRGVRERFYADVPASDLVLLSIDPTGLDVRYEPPAPGVEELFPHVYGPIPVSAVVELAPADLVDSSSAAEAVPAQRDRIGGDGGPSGEGGRR